MHTLPFDRSDITINKINHWVESLQYKVTYTIRFCLPRECSCSGAPTLQCQLTTALKSIEVDISGISKLILSIFQNGSFFEPRLDPKHSALVGLSWCVPHLIGSSSMLSLFYYFEARNCSWPPGIGVREMGRWTSASGWSSSSLPIYYSITVAKTYGWKQRLIQHTRMPTSHPWSHQYISTLKARD